jgi:hypothetical protein
MAPKPQNSKADTAHDDDITTTNRIATEEEEEEEHSPPSRTKQVTMGDATETTEGCDVVTSENMLRVRSLE